MKTTCHLLNTQRPAYLYASLPSDRDYSSELISPSTFLPTPELALAVAQVHDHTLLPGLDQAFSQPHRPRWVHQLRCSQVVPDRTGVTSVHPVTRTFNCRGSESVYQSCCPVSAMSLLITSRHHCQISALHNHMYATRSLRQCAGNCYRYSAELDVVVVLCSRHKGHWLTVSRLPAAVMSIYCILTRSATKYTPVKVLFPRTITGAY